MRTLSDRETLIVVTALFTAAEEYEKHAKVCNDGGFFLLGQQFEKQTTEARELASILQD